MLERGAGLAPNLANLNTIVVMGIIHGSVGRDEREPTDEEVKQLGRMLPNIVNATMWQGQILGPEKRTEAEEDDGE